MKRLLRRYELTSVAAAHAVLAIVATWPLVWRMGSALPGDLGDPLLNAFILGWDADRILHGLRGLWDAPFFYPFRGTLAYSEHLLGIAVFTAPLQWLTGNPVLVYNTAFLASYVLAGVGAYGLTRELWGRRDAAWVASVAFAFAPHRVMHVSHIQVLVSGWMPVALWALHRYFRTGSRRALAGFVAAFCLQGLSNGYFLYFFAVAVVVVGGVELVSLLVSALRKQPIPIRPARMLAELAAGALVVGLVFAPVAAAYYGLQRDLGLRRSPAEAENYSARMTDYWRADADLAIWGRVLDEAPAERSVFPGVASVVLAGAGVLTVLARRHGAGTFEGWRRHVASYDALAVVAVLLSLGPREGVYGWLMAAVPGFDGLRVPARFVVIVALALAVLVGAGMAWLLARAPRPRLAMLVAAGASLLIFAEGLGTPMHVEPFDAAQRHRAALHAWLATQSEGAMLELPIAGPHLESFTLPYQYATLAHGRPIVNGYSGWGSILQDFLAGPGTPVHRTDETDDLLEALSRLGIRFVVLHRSDFGNQTAGVFIDPQPLSDALTRSSWTLEAREFLPFEAWHLKGAPPVPVAQGELQPMAVGHDFLVTTSHRSDRLWAAVDGDAHSTWLNGQPQVGDEWLDLELARQRNVARLDLVLPIRALANYPRRLRVESVGPDGSVAVLFEGSVLPHVLAGLTRHPREPFIELALPPNDSARIRIAQTGQSPKWNWEVAELRAWRR